MREAILMAVLAFLASGQTKVDVQRQSKGTDFLMPPFSRPVRSGSSLPASCDPGELFFLSSAPAGGNLHVCHSAGEWAPQGSAGQGTLTIENNGTAVGVRPTANFLPGYGILHLFSDSGSRIDIRHSVDTATVMTRTSAQAGTVVFCDAHSSTQNNSECELSPTLTAYTTGMVLYWRPERGNGEGALTLEVDHLGPKAIKLEDGATDPNGGEFRAGSVYPLWFDGVAFRPFPTLIPTSHQPISVLQQGAYLKCNADTVDGSDYFCDLNPVPASYTPGMVFHLLPAADSSGNPLTLNVNGHGGRPIKAADGATDLESGQLRAGRLHLIWYDGTAFRVLAGDESPIAGGLRPNCSESLRGRVWTVPGEPGEKDNVSVCGKDEGDLYEWRLLY